MTESEVIEHTKALSRRQYRLSLWLACSLLFGPPAVDVSPVAYPDGYLWLLPIPIGLVWLWVTLQLNALYVDENGELRPRSLRVEERDES